MKAIEYFQRAEPLARKEREAVTRIKNAVMQFNIECGLASKRREPQPKPTLVLKAVRAHQQILVELTSLNEEFLSAR